uniref:Uncharacterized protein n=1 Tax=Rhodococcus hoagii TaxID=43767 RepID=Q9EU93_RHOHA|nr:unknown [Prescottella equi]BAB16637.1 hypothetical protein [Prescottella equi]
MRQHRALTIVSLEVEPSVPIGRTDRSDPVPTRRRLHDLRPERRDVLSRGLKGVVDHPDARRTRRRRRIEVEAEERLVVDHRSQIRHDATVTGSDAAPPDSLAAAAVDDGTSTRPAAARSCFACSTVFFASRTLTPRTDANSATDASLANTAIARA